MANAAFFFAPPASLGPPSPLLCDNVDPVTRDFADLFVGADPIDGAVQVAVQTTRGSGAAVQDVGVRITPRKITPSTPGAISKDLEQALGRLVRQRDIALESVTFGGPDAFGNPTGSFDESSQSGQVNVVYKNLRALDFRTRTLQLPAVQVRR